MWVGEWGQLALESVYGSWAWGKIQGVRTGIPEAGRQTPQGKDCSSDQNRGVQRGGGNGTVRLIFFRKWNVVVVSLTWKGRLASDLNHGVLQPQAARPPQHGSCQVQVASRILAYQVGMEEEALGRGVIESSPSSALKGDAGQLG